jgi:hypothetical protein
MSGPLQDNVTRAPLAEPDQPASQRAQTAKSDADRISFLEAQLAELQAAVNANKPKAPHGYMRNGEPAPSAVHSYDNPTDYPFTLVLATGETVGHSSKQSTNHWSRVLQQNVPVTYIHENEEVEAA